MFKLDPAPTFTCQVQITVPGGAEFAKLDLVCKHMGRKGLREWIDGASGQRDAQFLGAVIAGWEGVEDAVGSPVPYSAERLDELLDLYPAAGEEVFSAYLRALTEARAKN